MIAVFPEMLKAGAEALAEERKREASDEDTVLAVYLAMEAVLSIAKMRAHGSLVH